jgi:hypothetical protein
MTRPDRHDLIHEARTALETLPSDSDDAEVQERRTRLGVLVQHLEDGVLSPMVLEAVAVRVRATPRP